MSESPRRGRPKKIEETIDRDAVKNSAKLSGTATLIGGHEGLDVYKDNERIVKMAYKEKDVLPLENETRLLRILEDTHIAPKLIDSNEHWLSQTIADGKSLKDAGENNQTIVKDGENFRRQVIRFLFILRQKRIRNGDLTPPNLFVGEQDNLIAVDWQQSHMFDEPIKDRHHLSDSFLLWRTVSNVPSLEHPTPDTPRVIRRWMSIQKDLGGNTETSNLEGKKLLDLGCFMGDFCGMAAADGMVATGIDANVDALKNGSEHWKGMPIELVNRDITGIESNLFKNYDVILMFSTWSYIVQQYGRERAEKLLRDISKSNAAFYFENQLSGDGPGPDFLKTEEDMQQFLSQFGPARPVSDPIPVTGRPAFRTVWRVC